ncbi:hypothetical protein Daus18300_004255 [Diaporthe australafricana]|uniref:RNase H type-1 domain-containing protein n=1 Tax=Diaporthe australafricana TaxID=127596 RepID=A0ABR3X9T9_9PEZI
MAKKCRSSQQLNERSRKLARDVNAQKINAKQAKYQWICQNQNVRDTWIEDLDLVFAGTINIPATEAKAIETAAEASEAAFDPSNRFFFTYGASVADKTQDKTHDKNRLAAAAVIYKRPSAKDNNANWGGMQYELGHCDTTSGAEAGLVAISKCLSLATQELRSTQHQETAPKITIFTHYEDAITSIDRVRYLDSTKGYSEASAPLLEIVKKSRRLRDRHGVDIQLNWIPRHADVEGNRFAESAARKAAASQTPPAISC